MHEPGMARSVLYQMQQEEGGDCAGVTGIDLQGSLEDSLTQDTGVCLLAWMHARYSPGLRLRLCPGAGELAVWAGVGVTGIASFLSWISGHMEWTQSWAR